MVIIVQSGRSSQQCNINFGSDKGEKLGLRDEEVEEEVAELGKWLLDTKEEIFIELDNIFFVVFIYKEEME